MKISFIFTFVTLSLLHAPTLKAEPFYPMNYLQPAGPLFDLDDCRKLISQSRMRPGEWTSNLSRTRHSAMEFIQEELALVIDRSHPSKPAHLFRPVSFFVPFYSNVYGEVSGAFLKELSDVVQKHRDLRKTNHLGPWRFVSNQRAQSQESTTNLGGISWIVQDRSDAHAFAEFAETQDPEGIEVETFAYISPFMPPKLEQPSPITGYWDWIHRFSELPRMGRPLVSQNGAYLIYAVKSELLEKDRDSVLSRIAHELNKRGSKPLIVIADLSKVRSLLVRDLMYGNPDPFPAKHPLFISWKNYSREAESEVIADLEAVGFSVESRSQLFDRRSGERSPTSLSHPNIASVSGLELARAIFEKVSLRPEVSKIGRNIDRIDR
jgi:hypothetical protein